MGCDRSSPLKMNLVPEIRRRVLREGKQTKLLETSIFNFSCFVVGSVEVQVLPPFDFSWEAGGRSSSSLSPLVGGEGRSWKTPFVLGLREAS